VKLQLLAVKLRHQLLAADAKLQLQLLAVVVLLRHQLLAVVVLLRHRLLAVVVQLQHRLLAADAKLQLQHRLLAAVAAKSWFRLLQLRLAALAVALSMPVQFSRPRLFRLLRCRTLFLLRLATLLRPN
jgi:hypothetical protein